MRLIVVDANAAFATLLSEELSRLGYDVATYDTGTAALADATRDPPDMALLDMGLDNPDALTVARELRRLRAETRLVLIPMMGEEPQLDAAAPAIQGVLPKPFFLPDLPRRIEAALAAPLDGDGHEVTGEDGTDPARSETETTSGAADNEAALLEAVIAETAPLDLSFLEAWEDDQPSSGVESLDLESSESVDEDSVSDVSAAEDMKGKVPSEAATLSTPRGADAPQVWLTQQREIESVMGELALDIGADAVIVVSEMGGAVSYGDLADEEVHAICDLMIQSRRASAQVAQMLGCDQLRFEQSIDGGSYLLYAMSVADALLVVTIRDTVPLGLLRHRARSTAERVAVLLNANSTSRS